MIKYAVHCQLVQIFGSLVTALKTHAAGEPSAVGLALPVVPAECRLRRRRKLKYLTVASASKGYTLSVLGLRRAPSKVERDLSACVRFAAEKNLKVLREVLDALPGAHLAFVGDGLNSAC